jgi:transcriptional regulator
MKGCIGAESDSTPGATATLDQNDAQLARLRRRRIEESRRRDRPGSATANNGYGEKSLRFGRIRFHIPRMYQPVHFRTNDPEFARDLIRNHPFATLLTEKGTEINHLPLLLREDRTGTLILEGHVARGNSVARLPAGTEITAIFQGPDSYISPLWYVSPGQVPTWNYVVLHVYGKLVAIDEPRETLAAMSRLVRHFEGESGWSMDGMPEKARDGLLTAIRYFGIEVERTEIKAKLSQNRATVDRAAVLAKLDASDLDSHHQMAEYFRRMNPA